MIWKALNSYEPNTCETLIFMASNANICQHSPYDMRVLIVETNLMWSARLRKSLAALGHEAVVSAELPDSADAEVAIINLGSSMDPKEAVARLHLLGMYVIGHAGHKEKALLAYGQEAGCDRLATNSELTFKIAALMDEAGAKE